MKKIIITSSVIHICIIPMLMGQQFTFHSNSPFGIEIIKEDSSRAAQTITFYDYDRDGDLDVLLTGLDFIEDFNNWGEVHFFIEAQENIGSQKNPVFGERFELFEEFPYPYGYFFASPGDLNNDGEGDLIVAAEIDEIGNAKLQMFRNTGMPGSNQFNVSTFDPVSLPEFVCESLFKPELVDLDQDGDLDLMNSGFDPPFAVEEGQNIAQFYYARNIGTKSAPDFQGWYDAPYNLVPDTIGEFITHGDIDNDGDIDFIGSMIGVPADSLSNVLVHLNTPGPDHKPAFTTPLRSPFGLPSLFGAVQFAFPVLADIDDDGDLDLFMFMADANGQILQYYENGLCIGVVNSLSVTLCEGESIVVGGIPYSDAGDYTISLESTNGCDSTILLSITIDPIQTTFLNESICAGESYVIGNETFTASGDYMVFLVSVNGCDSLVLLTLSVDEVDNTVTVNENILTATESGASYQWIDCDSGGNIPGATNQSYEVTVTGNYAVLITDALDCSATSECVHVVITGIADVAWSNAITIYPNPADQVISIRNETPETISVLNVINTSGQRIGVYEVDGENPIDISILDPGAYLIKLSVGEEIIVRKLIVI